MHVKLPIAHLLVSIPDSLTKKVRTVFTEETLRSWPMQQDALGHAFMEKLIDVTRTTNQSLNSIV